nr:hypothetical protein ISGA_3996 [Gordonia sp. NB41Y]
MVRSSTIGRERAARRELRSAVDDLADAEYAAGLRPGLAWRWWAVIGVLVVASVLAAGIGVWAWVHSAQTRSDAEFEQAAASTVALLLSPNPQDPQQVRRILDRATGEFYDDFAQSSQAFTEVIRRNGEVASADIDGSGVSARTADDATVLVAATVHYEGAAGTDRQFRLHVGVAEDAGVLKVSAVQYLP